MACYWFVYFTTHVTKMQNKNIKIILRESGEEAFGETIGLIE